MVEIRVYEEIDQIRVQRGLQPEVVISVPQSSSWFELNRALTDHLTADELDLTQKLWCQDDFPRIFETSDGFVKIRPAVII